jgi:hypothetical protein
VLRWSNLTTVQRVALCIAGTAWIPLILSGGDEILIGMWLLVWMGAIVTVFVARRS